MARPPPPTSKGRTGAAMALADQQRKTRPLVAQRTNEAKQRLTQLWRSQ
jgi:hypothetical protein